MSPPISRKPFKRSSRSKKQMIPFKYQNIFMEMWLSNEPITRSTFIILFQKLFPAYYETIRTFLSVWVSRFSTFSMKSDIKQKEIVSIETLCSWAFGSAIHAFNKSSNQDFVVKEFNDIHRSKNEDFMLKHAWNNSEKGAGSWFMLVHGVCLEKRSREDQDKTIWALYLSNFQRNEASLPERIIHFDLKTKEILIRCDVVADFITAIHFYIDTHLRNRRGSENYMVT